MRLRDLAGLSRWCAWREEYRNGSTRPTKVPYGRDGRLFESNNPATWITLAAAEALCAAIGGSGVGIALGPLGNGWILGGIDYDTCIGAEGLTDWADTAIRSANGGHVEVSPSGTGVKQFVLVSEAQTPAVAAALFGGSKTGGVVVKWPDPNGGKAAGIEAYFERRFFAVTWSWLDREAAIAELTEAGAEDVRVAGMAIPGATPARPAGSVQTMTTQAAIPVEMRGGASEIERKVADAARMRPRLAALLEGDLSVCGPKDQSDSQVAWVISGILDDAGWNADERVEALTLLPFEPLIRWREKNAHDWNRQLARALGHDGWQPSRGESKALNALPVLEGEVVGEEIEDSGAWKRLLQVTKGKNPDWRSNLNNARIALLEAIPLKGMLAFNEFSDRIVVQRRPPYEKISDWKGSRDYEDRDCIQIAAWLQAEGLQVEPAKVLDASLAVAWEFRYDPVRAYLEKCNENWDGVGRLNLWMSEYLGAKPSTYTQAVAAMSLIGSVARVFEPGCKKDTMTLLEGIQGIYKSSTLRALYGSEYFVDHIPADISGKDALMQLAGKWCVEHAEMDRLSKAEASKVKVFVATQIDVYRRPYGRVTQEVPRRCVFWGTINPNSRGYLTDETGNRRFWPIQCADRPINLKSLRDVRDQLWGEATRRYLQGERWWMAGQAERQQIAQVAKRFDEDVWTAKVRQFLGPLESVSIAEVLRNGLGVTDDKQTVPAQNRVARILQVMGMQRKQVRHGPIREWRYVKPGKVAKSNIVSFPNSRESGDSGDTW